MKRVPPAPLVITLLAPAAILAVLPACRTRQSPARQVDDANIKLNVKARLAKDVRFTTLTDIQVNSTNGVVTLAGQVGSSADRDAAEKIARSVDGVVMVHNELQVGK